MNEIVFSIAVTSTGLLLLLSVVSLVRSSFEFFPPPSRTSWQYHLFWILFRLMFGGVVLLSFTTYNDNPFINQAMRFAVWLPLWISGFCLALYLSIYLGWENAHGEPKGLKVSGFYKWSRNPIYMSSFFGMLGLGLFVNSGKVYVLLTLWSSIYVAAIFIEERWLQRTYGAAFLSYKEQVPRFFGFPQKP